MTKRTWKQTRQVTYEQMKVYGESFRKLRESTGMNLEQFAEKVGTFRTTLSKWEKGLIIPQTDIKYIERKIKSIAEKYTLYGMEVVRDK